MTDEEPERYTGQKANERGDEKWEVDFVKHDGEFELENLDWSWRLEAPAPCELLY